MRSRYPQKLRPRWWMSLLLIAVAVFAPPIIRAYDCVPCTAPDNGFGTATFPYPCPSQPCCGHVMRIIDGLPPGTTVEIPIELVSMSLVSSVPGGSLGGTQNVWDGQLKMQLNGTGTLGGYTRPLMLPVSGMTDLAPQSPGMQVQPFDCDLMQLQGQIIGDPDFDLLRVTAGTGFGMPSPGHTTLTRSGTGWAVESFFDITYRIDFVGRPGGPLGGMSGSTTGTIRIYQGCPRWRDPDPVKMHFPQLPDTNGWDVLATYPEVLADDWRCTETGEVRDIHFWGSWQFGAPGRIAKFHLKIYSDVPAGIDATYSHPGVLLWTQSIDRYVMTPIPTVTPEGWFDPRPGLFNFPDHNEYWQYDILLDPSQYFNQVFGTIYWLEISAELEPGTTARWGWKSTQFHFNDDAVYIPPVLSSCIVPDNGFGTATQPANCPYVGQDPMMIIDGLPPGTTIECQNQLHSFAPVMEFPGGMLGGTASQWGATLDLRMMGTGMLSGYVRSLSVPITPGQGESHYGPRAPGTSPQSFPSDLNRMFGQLPPGDPDFDLLRITSGTGFGMPSPGHTTLTSAGGGNWSVDSFFDIEYRIDFIGAPGGPLAGMSGSTTGTIRIQQGSPAPLVPWRDLYEPPAFTQSLDLAFVITGGTPVGCCTPPTKLRGDIALPLDGVTDGSDLGIMVDYIFFLDSSNLYDCLDAQDVNDDNVFDGGDLGILVDYIFFVDTSIIRRCDGSPF